MKYVENKDLSKELNDMRYWACLISKSEFCPENYRGKIDEILLAIHMGNKIGLDPIQSLNGIAVIKGKASLFGDALLAVVRRSGNLEYCKEWQEDDTAYCEVKRRDESLPTKCSFSLEDAKKAKLITEKSPCWIKYPNRMLKMRARSFALRDAFADILQGMHSAEEVMDYSEEKRPSKITNSIKLIDQLKANISAGKNVIEPIEKDINPIEEKIEPIKDINKEEILKVA